MIDTLLSFLIKLTIKRKQISFLLEVGKQGKGRIQIKNIYINETSTYMFT